MYLGLLLLLSASGVSLGADLRKGRQTSQGSGSEGSSQVGFGSFQPFVQQLQNPDPQGFVTNPGQTVTQFTNQIPSNLNPAQFVGGQQQPQTQQPAQPAQPASFDFVNRNPPVLPEPIPIISYENIQPGDGTYRFSYETGNGIRAEESGEQKVVGDPPEAGTVARGSYSYTDLDGNQIALTYTADENGFQPVGAHLPTPPPIPKEIMAGLEQSAAAEAARNNGVISPSFHYFFRNFRRF